MRIINTADDTDPFNNTQYLIITNHYQTTWTDNTQLYLPSVTTEIHQDKKYYIR